MTFNLAVLGNPVAHSLSPKIHHLFASEVGFDVHYEKFLVEAEDFDDTVVRFFDNGGKGLNVTLPHKSRAYEIAKSRSEEARLAESVNTLMLDANGEIRGENTDGFGLLNDIEVNLGWPVQGQRVLMLGAGGAAQGVVRNLLQRNPAELVIANRTLSRAEAIIERYDATNLSARSLEELLDQGSFDLIISASSGGLANEDPQAAESYLPASLVGSDTRCYDMIYGKTTPLLTWAGSLGMDNRSDGLGMLVEQAAKSFHLWFDVQVSTGPVLRHLRDTLGA